MKRLLRWLSRNRPEPYPPLNPTLLALHIGNTGQFRRLSQ